MRHLCRLQLRLLLLNLGNISTLILIVLLLCCRTCKHYEDFRAEGLWHVDAENLSLELLVTYRLEAKRKKIKFKINPKTVSPVKRFNQIREQIRL